MHPYVLPEQRVCSHRAMALFPQNKEYVPVEHLTILNKNTKVTILILSIKKEREYMIYIAKVILDKKGKFVYNENQDIVPYYFVLYKKEKF